MRQYILPNIIEQESTWSAQRIVGKIQLQKETQNIKFSPSLLLNDLIYLMQGTCTFMKLGSHQISERVG